MAHLIGVKCFNTENTGNTEEEKKTASVARRNTKPTKAGTGFPHRGLRVSSCDAFRFSSVFSVFSVLKLPDFSPGVGLTRLDNSASTAERKVKGELIWQLYLCDS
jgi:hypothetical protein